MCDQSGTDTHRKDATMKTEQTLKTIARKHLGIETLEIRKSDRQDFHEVAVWSIEAALKAAFEAGKEAATKGAAA